MTRSLTRSAGFVAAIAITAVVSSGVAASAASLITSKQIKDETIQSRDIKNGTIAAADLAAGSITSKQLAGGSVGGAQLAKGSVGSAALAKKSVGLSALDPTVKLGPIASGRYAGGLSRSQPGVTALRLSAGRFCITVPGAPSSDHVIVVSPDWNSDDTATGTPGIATLVESGGNSSCPAGSYAVYTYSQTPSAVTAVDEGFVFVVN